MKIIHGDYEIIESGRIASADLKPMQFILSENPPLEIVFKIEIDLKNSDSGVIEIQQLSESSLAILFQNPQGLAYGNSNPIRVGNLEGKALYVSFRVDPRGNLETYTLDYTFYTKR